MWIIKYALAAIVLLAVMYFSFQNAQETTSIRLWKRISSEDVHPITPNSDISRWKRLVI